MTPTPAMPPDPADAYLTIPAEYGRALGGLHWSKGCDAVDSDDGPTLALVHQVGAVLEGAFAAPPVPPFAFVLHLLYLMKNGRAAGGPPGLLRLTEAFAAAGPAGGGRTAGLLIAELCRGLPPAANPPTWPQLELGLKRRLLFGERHRPELAEVPPLTPREFEHAVAERIETRFPRDVLAHWLKHGGPPADAGKLADELTRLPAGIGAVLDAVRRRPRLVGAAVLAPALDAALTFPPRRPRPDRVPQGGYADVTTRGDPAQLLPSQFALDPDEFVRRFAERELLYFRREEPHRPTAPERWLVLDQGVRAWGSVRLGLAAAVLALLGRDPRKAGDARLSLTSHPEPVDPTEVPPAGLADHLEASDLSPHPADALLRVLAADFPDGPPHGRDVVLLTHPRALREPDVVAAARLVGANDRLFALALDDTGRAELLAWGPAGPGVLRRFRVDLAAGEAATVPGKAAAPAAVLAGWAGDVEPIPFPFRAGLVGDVRTLGFDAAARWVVAVGRDGCVQAKDLDTPGSPVEVLPRAYRGGETLTQVDAVLGLTGGVAVCGRMPYRPFAGTGGAVLAAGASPPDAVPVVAHYDFAARAVRLHALTPEPVAHAWHSFPDLQCVVARWAGDTGLSPGGSAVDLGTGAVYPSAGEDGLISRARSALARSAVEPPYPVRFPVSGSVHTPGGSFFALQDETIQLYAWNGPWSTVRPTAEGKPLFPSRTQFGSAHLARDVLAVAATRPGGQRKLYLLHGPDGAVFGEVPAGNDFFLSADGRRVAVVTGVRAMVVRDTAPGGAVVDVGNASLHNRLHVALEPHRLRVRIGHFEHTFALNEVPFRHEVGPWRPDGTARSHPAGYGATDVAYDRKRFAEPTRAGPWTAAADKWGQVVLLNPAGKIVMCVCVRRDLAAAWLPDGTGWGAAALLGGPPAKSAAVRIGMALQAAAEGHPWK